MATTETATNLPDTVTNRLAAMMQSWTAHGHPGIPVKVLDSGDGERVQKGDTVFYDPKLKPAADDLVVIRLGGRLVVRAFLEIALSDDVLGAVVAASRPMLARNAVSNR